ncbi:MAG: MBL fold metallo-hydrolase [Armatimonadetes bacterium]|nr:MBL fold metallo-hydrolase [Armatimonadota bacterium]
MIIKRFYEDRLAQASYLIGCPRSGQALLIDPNRDVERYRRYATSEGLRITHVTETHIHADFLSGTREVAHRTGAKMYLSIEGEPDWKYGFGDEQDAVSIKGGDEFSVGDIRIEVIHVPGHTPEHVAFLVTDTSEADEPMGMFTGDFIFVGDVGRPDLLEKVAAQSGTLEVGARQLFHSLQRAKEFADYLLLWPGHGAGSACGRALGAVPASTLGYERRFNWAFRCRDESEFIRDVAEGQPDPPNYYAEMKRLNRDGPPLLDRERCPAPLSQQELSTLVKAGAPTIDVRSPREFASGHLPGSINIPLGRSFIRWSGWLLPYDTDLYLVVGGDSDRIARDAASALGLIGLDRVAGHCELGLPSRTGDGNGGGLARQPQISARELAEKLASDRVHVIDVRERFEWEEGHIKGSKNLPLGHLPIRLNEIPKDRPIAVHCELGVRSSIAASVLAAAGIENVINLEGGIEDWRKAGLPLEKAHAASRV